MRLGIREAARQSVDQGHEDLARFCSRVGLRSEAGFAGDDRRTELALGVVVVCVLKRCTAFPGENPGRPALVPAGST